MKAERHLVCFVAAAAFLIFTPAVWANPYMGEYKGTFHPDGKTTMQASAQVIAEGDDVHYRIVIKAIPNEENQDGADIEIYGHRQGSTVHIGDRAGGYHWNGQIQNGRMSIRSGYGQHFELDKFLRKSPKEGLKPPKDAVVLLPFEEGVKPDTSGWTNSQWKRLDNGAMQVNKGGNNSKEHFGDIEHFHLEFKLPLEPNNRGQGRANSGVYFAGQFEVQVLDSFGLVHTSGDCAGLYNIARARVNACLPPETWQTYDVKFRAPRLNADGSIKENPRITVYQNDILVHNDIEIPYSGNRWKGKKEATGPIHLQDHGHPIQYRNIWLVKGK
ncbi:MAG: 3-keto-disaccharide hydrolase [Planctomycetota bacterium]